MPSYKVDTGRTSSIEIGERLWEQAGGKSVTEGAKGFDTLRDLAVCMAAHLRFMGIRVYDERNGLELDAFAYLHLFLASQFSLETGQAGRIPSIPHPAYYGEKR